jgi:hypothetical protein
MFPQAKRSTIVENRAVLALAPHGVGDDRRRAIRVLHAFWESGGCIRKVAPRTWVQMLASPPPDSPVPVLITMVLDGTKLRRYIRRCEDGWDVARLRTLDLFETANGVLNMCKADLRMTRKAEAGKRRRRNKRKAA